jgi:hypothetical protein
VDAGCINPDYQTVAADVAMMQEENSVLDELIKSANEQFQRIVRTDSERLWVTHDDLVVAAKKAHKPMDRLLLPVHAPVGTSIECSSYKVCSFFVVGVSNP